MNYLHWKEEKITDFSTVNVARMYNDGFVFTRLGKGAIQQTRSCRIDLSKFEPSSENRRIIKKTEGISLTPVSLPLKAYDISLGKMAKDFYDNKFGKGTMSAQKIKEMTTDEARSNFTHIFDYSSGFAICHMNDELLHYSYPFYNLDKSPKDMGLGMMIRAIIFAKEKGLKYIYLGSLQRPGDTYKLQFSGLEWFDGTNWQTDTESLKAILK